MNTFATIPDVLTPAEAAKVLRVGRTTIYRLLKEKQIRSFQIGRKVLIPKEYIRQFVAASSELCYNDGSQMVGNPSCCGKE